MTRNSSPHTVPGAMAVSGFNCMPVGPVLTHKLGAENFIPYTCTEYSPSTMWISSIEVHWNHFKPDKQ